MPVLADLFSTPLVSGSRRGDAPLETEVQYRASRRTVSYVKDAQGHEHKGSGSGGGQFTSSGSGKSGSSEVVSSKPVDETTLNQDGWYLEDWQRNWVKNGEAHLVEVDIGDIVSHDKEPIEDVDPNSRTIQEMVGGWKEGYRLPAIELIKTPNGYKIADGRHRLTAQKMRGMTKIPAVVSGRADVQDQYGRPLDYVKDSSGREHKGKGKGGGQFTGSGGGGKADAPQDRKTAQDELVQAMKRGEESEDPRGDSGQISPEKLKASLPAILAEVSRHQAALTVGPSVDKLYEVAGGGLSPQEFRSALLAARDSGQLRLSGWSKSLDELPRPELAPMVWNKVMGFVHGVQSQYAKPLLPDLYAHAPRGGVTIKGQTFAGGQFIPAEVLVDASPEERAAVESGESRGKPLPPEGGVKEPKQKKSKSADPIIQKFLKPNAKFDDAGVYLRSKAKPNVFYGPFRNDWDARGAAAVVAGFTTHPAFREDKYSLAATPFNMAGSYGKGELVEGHESMGEVVKEGNLADLVPHPDLAKHGADFIYGHFGKLEG